MSSVFATEVGGGLDYEASHRWTVRVFDVTASITHVGGETHTSPKLGVGLILNIGHKESVEYAAKTRTMTIARGSSLTLKIHRRPPSEKQNRTFEVPPPTFRIMCEMSEELCLREH
jgi:hypothetical protein